MKSAITIDGYKYTPIYTQETNLNTLVIYKITQDESISNQPPEYFLSSSELSTKWIETHTFEELKSMIMPQHYEGFFHDEFTATNMARNIALKHKIF